MFLSFFQSNVSRESILRYSPILLLNFLENFLRYIRGGSNLLRQTLSSNTSDRQSERFNRCSGWTTKSLDEERLYVEYVCSARLVSPGSELHAEGLVGRDSRPGTSFIFYPVESKRGGVCVCTCMRECVGEKNREERRGEAGGGSL